MKNVDPLLLIPTAVVSLGLLIVLIRFAVTGEVPTEILTIMSTMLGVLVTAISTARKGGGPPEPPASPPPSAPAPPVVPAPAPAVPPVPPAPPVGPPSE